MAGSGYYHCFRPFRGRVRRAGLPPEGGDVAGFWSGLWHGVISPITFIISLFSDNVNICEIHNNGGWYNFGFLFGASIIFGGGAKGASSKRN